MGILSLGLMVIVGGLYGLHRYYFPFGSSHCCNKALSLALVGYAANHEGRFPDGGGSGASLALLAAEFPQWKLIAGKGGSAEAAENHYLAHGTLPDDLSTWHYVSGLTEDSDPGLALFWDKTGLTHAGMRQNPVRYEVCYVSGTCNLVSESEWPDFLARQQQLLGEDEARRLRSE